jgi:TetR/AcrR family transcriptional repressor of nem operon
METAATSNRSRRDAKARLLAAALNLIRAKGYSGTSVEDLCQAAGVTKGAFFHHFRSKDDLGAAAADHWSETTGALFANAPYHDHADPVRRILWYIDFRLQLIRGGTSEFTCLVGTMVQETYDTVPIIRAACEASICGHAARLEADIEQAMRRYRIKGDWTARDLALHTQAVLQGAFILAKATGDADAARASIKHLRHYLEMLFRQTPPKEARS